MPTERVVNTAVTRLINEIPTPIKDAIREAILKDGGSIPNNLMATAFTGMVAKTAKYYNYGKNHYIHGLPEGDTRATPNLEAEVIDTIDTIEGEPITLLTLKYDIIDAIFIGHKYMAENEAWDEVTNIVGSPPFTPDPVTADVYPFDASFGINDDEVIITYTYEGDDGGGGLETKYVDHTHTVLGVTLTNWVYMVTYTIDSDVTADIKYWFYDPTTGTYPDLNAPEPDEMISPFYPVVPIRRGRQNVIDVGSDEEVHSCKRIMQKLAIDYETLTNQITDPALNPGLAQEDVDVLDYIYMHFAISLRTDTEMGTRYLYDFFLEQANTATYTEGDWTTWAASSPTSPPQYNIVNVEDDIYRITIKYAYALVETAQVGVIGEVGEYEKTLVDNPDIGVDSFTFVDDCDLILRLQTSATEYTQITVHSMYHNTIASRGYLVQRTIKSIIALEDDTFFIPLARHLTVPYTGVEETKLYTEALSILIYTLQEYDLEWWETPEFAQFLTIVAFIYFVFTFDPSAFTLTGLLLFIAKVILINLTVNWISQQLSAEDALKLAFVIAVVRAFSGDSTGFTSLIFAESLMFAVTALIGAANKIIQDDFKDLSDEYSNFLESAEEKSEDLEKAHELLESDGIDPYLIIEGSPYFNPNESPEAYYTRTIHTGNPGVISLDTISSYVDDALKLPEANDSPLPVTDMNRGYYYD